jgi:inward rectifier potassium channel
MATLDPGLGEKFSGRTQRAIKPDGTFNVRRQGGPHRHDPYQWLIQMGWGEFIGVVVGFFIVLNAVFALGYQALGLENLPGVSGPHTPWGDFLSCLFFSIQTFTSVGYGHVYPAGNAAGALSSLEALTGVLTFALATGLLYGRFSRPTARLLFTRRAIISRRPDTNLPCLQFRLANQRSNTLIDISIRVLLRSLDAQTGNYRYNFLPLERDNVSLLPLSWTLVHDITPDSPLHGLSAADYQAQDFELLVLVKAYDDTFAQDVHARFSYIYTEIDWERRFVRAYHVAPDGVAVIDLDKLDATEALP